MKASRREEILKVLDEYSTNKLARSRDHRTKKNTRGARTISKKQLEEERRQGKTTRVKIGLAELIIIQQQEE